jgi:hypothetical protein
MSMIKITGQILTSNEPIDIDREEKEWIIFRDFLKTKNGCHIMELISSTKVHNHVEVIKMDEGYFDLLLYKFKKYLGSVSRAIMNKRLKNLEYLEGD